MRVARNSQATRCMKLEVVHEISILPIEKANAARLLELTRDHWGIENELHYRRDVTMREDQGRIRKGVAPQIMAALRNSIIHALGKDAANGLATTMLTMANCFSQALSFLGLPQRE